MDSPLSGHNDELLRIEIDKPEITFSIFGPAHHPKVNAAPFADEKSRIDILCEDAYSTTLFEDVNLNDMRPLFFEQQDYTVSIEFPKGENVEFWHDNLFFRERVRKIKAVKGASTERLEGIINFEGNVGFSDFIVLKDGKKYLTVRIEVYPVKLDYKKDYKILMDDLIKEFYNLVFEYLRSTYYNYRLKKEKKSSPVEFMEILNNIYGNFMRSVELIIRQPHHVLQTNHEVVGAHKARRIDNKSIRWIEKHSENVVMNSGNIYADRILAVRKEVTYDTRENQLTKFILQNVLKRLNLFKKTYMAMKRKKDFAGVITPINGMINAINSKITGSFLREVSSFKGQGQLSLVFSMAPGYRELYKYYIMLQHGLEMFDDVYRISIKDLSKLYEYWCFIKLNSILRNKFNLTATKTLKPYRGGLFVTLTEGKKASVLKYKTSEGEEISLIYNGADGYPTGPQKPDNMLSISKQVMGEKVEYKYVFDAKYKIDMAKEGSTYYKTISKTPGPEVEDINVMHRYRDAIVYSHAKTRPWERLMFGAYVLFPLPGAETAVEEYKKHMFYKSIEEVNIGGLPFMPSSTELVENFLAELIGETAEESEKRPPRQKNEQLMLELYKKNYVLQTEERDGERFDVSSGEHTVSFPLK